MNTLPGTTNEASGRNGRARRAYEIGETLLGLGIHVGIDTLVCTLEPIASADYPDEESRWTAIIQAAQPYARECLDQVFASLLHDLSELPLDEAIYEGRVRVGTPHDPPLSR